MPLLRIDDINLSRGSRPVTMKKVAPYFLRVGILAALAIPAFAETRTISWDPVTTYYFTAKDILSTGEVSALTPAYAWVVAPATPAPAAPKKIGIMGPISSGTTAVWRLAWDQVTTYANGAPLDPGRTVRYTAYWTDDPALSAASLRQLASLISGTILDFDPSANQMAKNKVVYLTVRAILDTGDPSSLAPSMTWRVENLGPVPPGRGRIIKK
jgi:hypothetical protein